MRASAIFLNKRPFLAPYRRDATHRFASWCSRSDSKSPVIAFLQAWNSDGNGETGGGKEEEQEEEEEDDAGRKAEVGGEERGGIGKISKQISD